MFKIIENEKKIEVYTPYNTSFVVRIKKISATWDGTKKAWITLKENINIVRDIMLEVYGENDIEIPQYVDVELTFTTEYKHTTRSDLRRFGQMCLTGWGRDSGIKTANENVSIIRGSANTSGSFKNWYIKVEEGTKIIMRKIPLSKWDEYKNNYTDQGIEVKLLEDMTTTKKNLEAEKIRLLDRLKEIEIELKSIKEV